MKRVRSYGQSAIVYWLSRCSDTEEVHFFSELVS